MRVLLDKASAEIEVKKSKFIAIAYPIKKIEDAKEMVLKTRTIHPNANHVVHAAIAGDNGTIFSCSDDKEPKNTAGRPALEVLKGSGITNICVCIVRYFGGTLLGTGGLVKAYSDSTKEVLKAVKTEELIERLSFKLMLQYENYTLIKRALEKLEATNTEEDFATGITITGLIPSENKDALIAVVNEIGQGSITISIS